MTSKKTTRRALFSSIVSLILCCSMLVGTTYAWFTDEVKSVNNVITAGNLDIEATVDGVDISEQAALFQDILWEPGVVAYEKLTVSNEGTLALKYQMTINFTGANTVMVKNDAGVYVDTGYGLDDVLQVAIVPLAEVETHLENDDRNGLVNSINDWTLLKNFREAGELHTAEQVAADNTKVTEETFVIAIWWEPSSDDNNWNVNNDKTTSDSLEYLHIDLGLNVYATQLEAEEDSFGPEYDAGADLPVYGVGSGEDAEYDENASAYEVPIVDKNTNKQVGFVVVYEDALTGKIEDVEATIVETDLYEGLTVQFGEDEEAVTYDIEVVGMKEGVSEAKVGVKAMPGYNQAKIYHYNELVDTVSYNEGDSYVEFATDSFSPFTVIFSNVEEDLVNGIPQAVLEDADHYENKVLEWESFGSWSPSHPEHQTLYSAYVFKAPHTKDTVEQSAYKGWYCDFYVSADAPIPAGAIFLGGNYGEFGWVGFESPENVDANVEVPLLGYTTSTPWTYEDICTFVGEFACGVAETYGHEGELNGITFTVKLRLTNPENEDDFKDVNTVHYTFNSKPVDRVEAGTQEALKGALDAAVTAGNDVKVTLSEGNYELPSVNNGNVTIAGDENTVITIAKPNYSGANLTLSGVTVKGSGYSTGVQHVNTVTYNDVTIDGEMCLYGEKVVFNNCTFNLAANQYIWTYGVANVEFNNCTFNTAGKAILIYNEGDGATNAIVKGCTFNATAGATAGDLSNQKCAAIEINNWQSSGSTNHTLITEDNTVDEDFSGEWRIKKYVASEVITVNGVKYTQVALDGKLIIAENNLFVDFAD